MNLVGAGVLAATFSMNAALASPQESIPASPTSEWRSAASVETTHAPGVRWGFPNADGALFGLTEQPDDPLEAAAYRLERADPMGAIRILKDALERYRVPKQVRSAARLLLGSLYLRTAQPNLASEQFTRVRMANDSLAEESSYLEALADFRRGRYAVAARECRALLERWPKGHRALDCTLLAGQAYAKEGRVSSSASILQPIIANSGNKDDIDTARLAIAEATAVARPDRTEEVYSRLACHYRFPTTRLQATAQLAQIEANPTPEALTDQMACAVSARDSLLRTEAWEAYVKLRKANPGNAKVDAWANREGYRFEYKTRRFEPIARRQAKQYEANPSGKLAWSIHRSFVRAGNWAEAKRWGDIGLAKHTNYYRWRRGHEAVAWASMLNGDYRHAAELWDVVGRGRGQTGSMGRWYAAFSRYRAGELTAAKEGFDTLESQRFDAGRLRYFRWRIAKIEGDKSTTRQLERSILQHGEGNWWTMMLRARQRSEDPKRLKQVPRDGRWPGLHFGVTPTATSIVSNATPMLAHPARGSKRARRVDIDWSQLAQSPPAANGHIPRVQRESWAAAEAEPTGTQDVYSLGYLPGPRFDPRSAESTMEGLAAAHGDDWPELHAAYSLARVGAYSRAGQVLSGVLRELDEDGAKQGTRAADLRKANIPASTWTEARLFTRAHYFVAKAFYKASTSLGATEAERHARQLSLPIAWPEFLWPASQQRDLDPLLVLALIRKESLYRADAVSSAGAIGLMQVMPTTGALVAAGLNEPTFSPRLLSDPETSIRMGTAYLSWLSKRFDGVLPLMIGSYNAGPYAVSTWLNDVGETIELDDWVEQIPYRETRRYVKAVLGAYGAYVAAYHPNETVTLDLTPKGNDASVVDF